MRNEQIRAELAGIFGAGGYQAPRISAHSAEQLRHMTIDINACNSAFGANSLKDGSEGEGEDSGKGEEAVSY